MPIIFIGVRGADPRLNQFGDAVFTIDGERVSYAVSRRGNFVWGQCGADTMSGLALARAHMWDCLRLFNASK